jgi:hypothetical protein
MSRASRWCSIQGRQSREQGLVNSFRRSSQRPDRDRYSGNSGSRCALRRALVAAADVVERTKLQRTLVACLAF